MFARLLKQFKISPRSARLLTLLGGAFFVATLFAALFADYISPYNPNQTSPDTLQPPSLEHIMGTDTIGRDILSRMIHGSRNSLLVGFLAVVLSFGIGAPFGATSGYVSGKLDRCLTVFFDALYAFPGLILAILIAFVLGGGAFNTAVAVSAMYIPQYFRVLRGIAFSLKERTFIEAERALGASDLHIVFRHVFPHGLHSIIVLMTVGMADAIISVAGLGFLGLGIPPPTSEWGTDLGLGRDVLAIGAWWPSTFPGLMIMITVLAFSVLGIGINDIIEHSSITKR